MPEILFYGPVGGKVGTIIGGGESGNRKTIAVLKRLGFEVVVIEKPYPLKNVSFGALIYPFQIIKVYFDFLFKSILKRKKISFHLSGFYNHLIYFEWLFIITSKLLKIHSVYEIRAGGAIEGYYGRSALYRFFFKSTIKHANSVLCQGLEYVPFINNIAQTNAIYYPNYITKDAQKEYSDNGRKFSNIAQLIYFGRIAPSKNIEFIIEICKKLSNINFECEIVGGGDEKYIENLQAIIDTYQLADKIKISSPMNSEMLFALLESKHFFLFPSQEKREGHSNSLTEAMSRGVVPVASNVGFNATVIQNPSLIISKYDITSYSSKIREIWESGTWEKYSKESYRVVMNFYTETAVEAALLHAHQELPL